MTKTEVEALGQRQWNGSAAANHEEHGELADKSRSKSATSSLPAAKMMDPQHAWINVGDAVGPQGAAQSKSLAATAEPDKNSKVAQNQRSSLMPTPTKLSTTQVFEAPPTPPPESEDDYGFPPSLSAYNQNVLQQKQLEQQQRQEEQEQCRVQVHASSPGKPPSPEVRRDTGYLSPPLHMAKRSSSQGTLQAQQVKQAQGSEKPEQQQNGDLPHDQAVGTSQTADQSAATAPATPNLSSQPLSNPSLVRAPSRLPEDRPLVGNLIGEDHVNYVLMYNMLTGIRIGVSRCQAKMRRPLTDEDYHAQHKFSFDMVGNEVTPSARYDFKFKDYAPWVFRELREHFLLDPADYLVSLTAKYILSELGSPGKSGSFFYFSRDYRFIIKTIHRSEHKFLRKILKQYHEHVKTNPHTLISRFYGLHRVKLPHGRKIHFVIMNNLMPPHRDVHETFDLKGSSVNREYPEDKAAVNPRATLKDINWLHRKRTLDLGPEKQALFQEQLRSDVKFLQHLGIMDYSLLVGIHDVARGNRDKIREGALTLFDPNDNQQLRRRRTVGPKRDKNLEAQALRQAIERSDPKAISENRLPDKDRSERRYFIFYQDEGGLQATDDHNQPLPVIYYMGVIDILTPYGVRKGMETFFKGFVHDRHAISPVPPVEYGNRFLAFMSRIGLRPGTGGEEKEQKTQQ